jgi:hypothetical protein
MYQVVIDTNVLVAALLSNRGASHRLLRLVGDPRWRINLSVPLVFEYEQTLKRVCTGGSVSGSDIDSVKGKGDVLMCPSWILLPFILPLAQRIGSETLIAGRLRVRPPVTHPRHSESSVNAQNGLDDPEQLSHTETACWSIT